MPELPEVETVCRGIAPHITQQTITHVTLRKSGLRRAFHPDLPALLQNTTITHVSRRAKYVILQTPRGILSIHLGMSGRLLLLQAPYPEVTKHDHVDIVFQNNMMLRLNDARRFGSVDWFSGPIEHHPLLQKLGVEPLSSNFTADYLMRKIAQRKQEIKQLIGDNSIVVGVGNIYASESLFDAAIHPKTCGRDVTHEMAERLVIAIKQTLKRAIVAGGSTLKDFVGSDGHGGYFQHQHQVYGRENETCRRCHHTIKRIIQGQRSTFFCPTCQVLVSPSMEANVHES